MALITRVDKFCVPGMHVRFSHFCFDDFWLLFPEAYQLLSSSLISYSLNQFLYHSYSQYPVLILLYRLILRVSSIKCMYKRDLMLMNSSGEWEKCLSVFCSRPV